jgi:hypothetical protein
VISIGIPSLFDRLLNLWPPLRRRKDAELREAIRFLCEHPEAPCVIGGRFIPNGYGGGPSLFSYEVGAGHYDHERRRVRRTEN